MKTNLYIVLVALIVCGLTACQAAPTIPTTSTEIARTEFFKDQPGRWISVRPPTGWEAHLGGTGVSPSVVVTDNWKGYSSTNTRAIGIVIAPLPDKGSAEQVLQSAIGRLQAMLTTPIGHVLLEQVADQSYASIEYDGLSSKEENASAHYFLGVITTNQRSVLVYCSVDPDQIEGTRFAYQSTLKAITLH